MRDLPLLTLQQLRTYGIMYEHVNQWHSIKARTLRENPNLTYNDKQTCEQRNRKLKSIQEG